MSAVDTFSGAGGWCCGAASLGFDPLGIEWDEAACKTRERVGFPTLQADVAALEPVDFGPIDGVIGSPPCPSYSVGAAGKGTGAADMPVVLECAAELARGVDRRAEHRERVGDVRSLLAIEPLRWTLALRPEWVAWEQVPPVLPLWEQCGGHLRASGYSVWTGILSAERYGVPQTRKRAVLMASRSREMGPPTPTHQAYLSDVPSGAVHTLEGVLEAWISMAQALGWGMTERPAPAVVGSSAIGGRRGMDGGSGARRLLEAERERGAWIACPRGERKWIPGMLTEGENAILQAFDPPVGAPDWPWRRPATTIMGDSRVSPPGYRGRPEDYANGGRPDGQMVGAIKLAEPQSARLQGFPPAFPWQGTKGERFMQIGNAVPPPLARAILEEVRS
jgi:DNA (cytosine-5)-methyltransferase 1